MESETATSTQPLIANKPRQSNYARITLFSLLMVALIAGAYFVITPAHQTPSSVTDHRQFMVEGEIDEPVQIFVEDVLEADKKNKVQCETGGCSNHICAVDASKMITTCEFKCEYGCLQYQKCAYSKKKGECGWKTIGSAKSDYKQCVAQCSGGSSDVCSLPKEVGPCRAAMPRWFFNSKIGACESFTYGGCQGNDNNFSSEDDCKAECVSSDICSLPAEVGPCKAVLSRWFYNSKSGACEEFSYGGCQGNENNFESKKKCKKSCA